MASKAPVEPGPFSFACGNALSLPGPTRGCLSARGARRMQSGGDRLARIAQVAPMCLREQRNRLLSAILST